MRVNVPRQSPSPLPYLLLVVALLSGGVIAWPSEAVACAPPRCSGEWAIPWDVIDDGPVPANLGGIVCSMRGTVDESSVALEDITTGTPVSVPVSLSAISDHVYLVTPTTSLNPNSTYRFNGDGCVNRTYTFATGESATLPATLGTLTAAPLTVGALHVATVEGGCSTVVLAGQVQVSLELSAEAQPWQGAFIYSTYVNGNLWEPTESLVSEPVPGGSWIGRRSSGSSRSMPCV